VPNYVLLTRLKTVEAKMLLQLLCMIVGQGALKNELWRL